MRFETKEGYDLTKEYESDDRFYDSKKEIHAWLELAPPAEVYNYLKEYRQNNPYGRNYIDDLYDQRCESILLRRNDPLINTGLALFAQNEDVCQFIYSHGDGRFKAFILSGQITSTVFFGHWFDREIKLLIKDEKIDYLRCVVKNINTTDSFLRDFIERKRAWSNLSTESWALLLMFLCKNPKLRSYLPRFPQEDYDYRGMIKSIWALFESIDLETLGGMNRSRVLYALGALALNLRMVMLSTPFGISMGPSFDTSNVCERWKLLKSSLGKDEKCEDVCEVLDWLDKHQDAETYHKMYIRNLRFNEKGDDAVPFTREFKRLVVEQLSSSEENINLINSEVSGISTKIDDVQRGFNQLFYENKFAEARINWILRLLIVVLGLLTYIALK